MTHVESKLYVCRHGETAGNIPGEEVLRGLADFSLTAHGRRQARELGERLKAFGVSHVACDDTLRSRQTADAVSNILQVEPIHDPGLRPWDIGDFEGKPEVTAKPRLMSYVFSPHVTVPGGEPNLTFFNRWEQTFWYYISRVRETRENWAIIIHSGQFATLDDVLLERGQTPTPDYEPTPGQIVVVSLDGTLQASVL